MSLREHIRQKNSGRAVLLKLARQELGRLRSARPDFANAPLVDLVPVLIPNREPPYHLAPYAERFERAVGTETHTVFAAPPQHGKTETTKAGIVLAMHRHPGLSFAYVTYSQARADSVSRSTREIARLAGLQPEGNLREWRIKNGSEIRFTSVGGPLTGSPINGLLVIDDPIKDRKDAESKLKRDTIWEWLWDVAISRMHPGASAILMATRWHVDDPSGRAIKELGWPYLNLKVEAEGETDADGIVISDPLGRRAGEFLWPAKRPAEFLAPRRANAYGWASLYQGEPRPRGGALFQEPTYYRQVPEKGYRVGYGVDLAYTAKTLADYSVCIRMLRVGDDYYVTDVVRRQVDAPSFTLALSSMHSEMRGPMRWYASGTEAGAGQFVKKKIPTLQIKNATGDKFVRAQPVAEAWNQGRVMVPDPDADDAPTWVGDFIDEIVNFTGQRDPHDDQVDALAAAFDLLKGGGSGSGSLLRVKSQWT